MSYAAISDVLATANDLVTGERAQAYGDPAVNLNRIAGMWSAYLGVPVSAVDVSFMLAQVKMSRNRTSSKADNAIDAVAYCAMAGGLDHGANETNETEPDGPSTTPHPSQGGEVEEGLHTEGTEA